MTYLPTPRSPIYFSSEHEESVVNTAFYMDALAMTERHIAQGDSIIFRQCRVVDRLDACGIYSTIAKAAKGVAVEQHTDRLAAIGVDMSKGGVANKVSRGGFSAAFLLECMDALDLNLDLEHREVSR